MAAQAQISSDTCMSVYMFIDGTTSRVLWTTFMHLQFPCYQCYWQFQDGAIVYNWIITLALRPPSVASHCTSAFAFWNSSSDALLLILVEGATATRWFCLFAEVARHRRSASRWDTKLFSGTFGFKITNFPTLPNYLHIHSRLRLQASFRSESARHYWQLSTDYWRYRIRYYRQPQETFTSKQATHYRAVVRLVTSHQSKLTGQLSSPQQSI